jgi:hypothetical protein
MNSLEINKALCEMENIEPVLMPYDYNVTMEDPETGLYYRNFLDDDALCFRLMLKYGIDFSRLKDDGEFYACWSPLGGLVDTNPRRVICLSAIHARKALDKKNSV